MWRSPRDVGRLMFPPQREQEVCDGCELKEPAVQLRQVVLPATGE